MKKREINTPVTQKEIDLEELLFGKQTSVLPADKKKKKSKSKQKPIQQTVDSDSEEEPNQREEENSAVWKDEADDQIVVDLNQQNRTKKLKKSNDGNFVSGQEFSTLLKERFQTSKLAWATADPSFQALNKKTHKTAPQFDDGGNENNEDEGDEDDFMHPSLLNQSASLTKKGRRAAEEEDKGPLPPTHIQISRLPDANFQDPSEQRINSLSFHSNSRLLMVGGWDHHLKFFSIDGERNEKQMGVHFPDMPICSASFLSSPSSSPSPSPTSSSPASSSSSSSFSGWGEREVVVSGPRPYFYTYDLESGAVRKIPGPRGRQLKSLEHMTVGGGMIGFRGESGYLHLLSSQHKTFISDIKINSGVRAATILNDGRGSGGGGGGEGGKVLVGGVDGAVYLWDLRRTAKCLEKYQHEDGRPISSLSHHSSSSSSSSSLIAIGSESGVATLLSYSPSPTASTSSSSFSHFSPLKSFLNITTRLSTLSFHPSGEILALASNEKKNQLRLVHTPTQTIYNNWPGEKTALNTVNCMAFSPYGGGYMVIGGKNGRAMLYRLNHYPSA